MITIPKLKKITLKELRKEWIWIKSIEVDNSPIQKVSAEFITVLKDGENYINSEAYAKRIKGLPVLGLSQAKWLVDNQDKLPELKDLLGKVYIDFLGTVVLAGRGHRYFPYLSQGGKRWYLSWHWFGNGFNPNARVAVSSSSNSALSPSNPSESMTPLNLRVLTLENEMKELKSKFNF